MADALKITQPSGVTLSSPQGLMSVGARRPLISEQGALAGFEFRLGETLMARLIQRGDPTAGAAQSQALLAAMRLSIQQGFVALTELPLAWLAHCTAPNALAPGMYFLVRPSLVPESFEHARDSLARLRAAGAQVGWRQIDVEPLMMLGAPDFVAPRLLPDMSEAAQRHALRLSAQTCPQVPQLLLDMPDVDAMESLLKPPVCLATCRMDAGSASLDNRALPPHARSLMQLLARLVRNEDVAVLAAEIKSDVALSVRLLQFLNSAGATPGRPLESIEHAVMVLGRDALYRWTSQLLVRQSPPRPAGQMLQAMALARARLLESLSRAAGEAQPECLYLLGLASVLPRLLHCSLQEAAEILALPSQAVQALMDQGGPWAHYLLLAKALDAADEAPVAKLSQPFGGPAAVQALADEAWRSGLPH
ncbi:HDOD domain-containing protein [Roseateles koreensis]|uniref:HDOD domain-containing protein n=1 Tax=Roseateles koreensis TaxID=2987526 RepID=A0ABT5KLI5_9BURK|nr:HDOD domain-containing protein [Roseateles koreensis]MDC8783761.1 HDOD domain-containing protein [Roseateles koreensis]